MRDLSWLPPSQAIIRPKPTATEGPVNPFESNPIKADGIKADPTRPNPRQIRSKPHATQSVVRPHPPAPSLTRPAHVHGWLAFVPQHRLS